MRYLFKQIQRNILMKAGPAGAIRVFMVAKWLPTPRYTACQRLGKTGSGDSAAWSRTDI